MYGILKIAKHGSIFEKEIREISNLDYKLENGRYQYRRKDIIKIIERLQRKR